MDRCVGVIGLGIMGRAYALNLMAAGFDVCGYDVDEAALGRLQAQGLKAAASVVEVAQRADVLILALATPAAMDAVFGADGLAASARPGTIVVDTGTFPVEVKQKCAEALRGRATNVLDCPVSGTGAQALEKDLIVYASGDERAIKALASVFEGFARKTIYVGAFGAGVKMKCIANHLVTIHNLATAEALLLAARSGLDPRKAYEAVYGGAGSSRMFEVRGPLMVEESYEPPTMKFDVYVKDIDMIHGMAREALAPTPLFDAAVPYYYAALAQGRAKQDTAGLYGVLKQLVEQSKKSETL